MLLLKMLSKTYLVGYIDDLTRKTAEDGKELYELKVVCLNFYINKMTGMREKNMDYYTLVLDPKYFQNVDTYKKGMLVFVDGYLKQKKTKLELGNPISADIKVTTIKVMNENPTDEDIEKNSFAKIFLLGYLYKDPEEVSMENGSKFYKFGMGCSHFYVDKETGIRKTNTDSYYFSLDPKYFRNVEIYKKGMLVFVDGLVRQRKFEKEGVKVITFDLKVTTIKKIVDAKDDGSSDHLPF